MSIENLDNQMKDSDMIFKQIITCEFDTYHEVENAITGLYIPDMSISRAGISHALGRLKKHFDEKEFYRNEVK